MIWKIDRVTNELNTYHISKLITNLEQFAYRNFTDAIALEDGRALFFTSGSHYLFFEDGQFRIETNSQLFYPVIHAYEEGQLTMSISHGSKVATFDLATEYLAVEDLAGNPTDYARRIIHIDNEGYHWIMSNQDGLRRYKDGVAETITDTLYKVDPPNFFHRFTTDDQLALWWDNDNIYALHNSEWTVIDLLPFDMFIYRSECTPDNTLLLYGARKVLECRVENGQVKLEDISDQYSPLALASIQLSSPGEELQLFYQKSTQELWQQQARELPQKIGQLSLAPIYHYFVQQDDQGRIWCLSAEEPFLLVDDQWTGMAEIFPANMDRIVGLLMLDDYQPLVLQLASNFQSNLQLYDNGQWQLLYPEELNSFAPPLNYQRLYKSDIGDIWALDVAAGFSLFQNRQRFDFRTTDFFPSPLFINDLYENGEGQLLISSDLGLYILEENGNYEFRSFNDLGVEIANTFINAARFDENGAWWFGSGLYVYRYQNNELLQFPVIDNPELFSVTVSGIFPFASDNIWVTFGSPNQSFGHFNGQSWSYFGSQDYDLPLYYVQSMVKEPNSNIYWASGLDGLFKITIGDDNLPESSVEDYAYSVFPNPSCCTFTVEWEQVAGEVILSLSNVLGQPVRELLKRSTAAGTYRHTFNRYGLDSGTYFLQIKEGDRTKTIPLIIH
ncbi:MAG: T9SS type A sorting domain-containing protein [Bacteroidota bacterium]